MNKEIGGYFELDSFNCDSEYYNAISLNSGRNALAYLIQAKGIKKIYLPFYICDSVKNTCHSLNVEISFYQLTDKLEPDFCFLDDSDKWLYLVNYFGLISNKRIKDISKKYKNLIVDNVQAFFQKPLKNIDTIYSCRKFFGVPDGSYLFTSTLIDKNLPVDDSSNRLNHLKGRLAHDAKSFYAEYLANEKNIDNLPLMAMSETTRGLLKRIDYNFCKKSRTRNISFLHKNLKSVNNLKIEKIIPGGYAYPLLVNNGSKLREFLISHNVYVPLLWPFAEEKQANYFSSNILPLPCDHRYSKSDMEFIIQLINEYENRVS